MKKYILCAGALLLLGKATAQQQPQFSHYGLNGMSLNPAYAGVKGYGEITGIGRIQYYGYNPTFYTGGSPTTASLTASLPVAVLGGGLGLGVYRDRIAELYTTNVQLSYSRHLKLGEGTLGLGVQGIFNNIYQGTYKAVDDDDIAVPREGSDAKFDAGAGVWYEAPKLYVGLSLNNLLRSGYRFKSEVATSGKSAQYLTENHAYLTGGYNIDLTPDVVLTPTALVKLVLPGEFGDSGKLTLRNASYEVGARATFNDRFWGGLGYRSGDAFTALGGISFAQDNALRLGLAYDLIAFGQEAKATSSFEIMLSYRLPKPSLSIRPAIRTPRYSF
ncbi:PorP/SprF family type IX secretion system membrane protein [Hymenobacter actinosclerus]|uniref:Type IX secretion system membrane protein, PorP/SprF family n=1 Tax=Hymenobacter actinosclerus TaxID=82805 RepID=A0A1H9Z8C5_9BACT|nr:PorP/SprF family type IX secretion system membrane protein [Hymenobacter actinosclerus]SES77581.1 type IX secretion system membrane protein, PorP/SprF family [Hymenobacter actinosclerus]